MSQTPSSTPGGTSSRRSPTPAEIVTMAGGGVAFIFSFLPFYTFSFRGFGSSSTSAWGSGLFPIATFIALFALAAGVLAALDVFGVSLPERMLSFTTTQLILVFGFFAALLAAGYLIQSRGAASLGFGYYFVLLGAIATLVGGVMMMVDANKVDRGGAL